VPSTPDPGQPSPPPLLFGAPLELVGEQDPGQQCPIEARIQYAELALCRPGVHAAAAPRSPNGQHEPAGRRGGHRGRGIGIARFTESAPHRNGGVVTRLPIRLCAPHLENGKDDKLEERCGRKRVEQRLHHDAGGEVQEAQVGVHYRLRDHHTHTLYMSRGSARTRGTQHAGMKLTVPARKRGPRVLRNSVPPAQFCQSSTILSNECDGPTHAG
jgi:hypothetical protein